MVAGQLKSRLSTLQPGHYDVEKTRDVASFQFDFINYSCGHVIQSVKCDWSIYCS